MDKGEKRYVEGENQDSYPRWSGKMLISQLLTLCRLRYVLKSPLILCFVVVSHIIMCIRLSFFITNFGVISKAHAWTVWNSRP